jgi:hypothetical protein
MTKNICCSVIFVVSFILAENKSLEDAKNIRCSVTYFFLHHKLPEKNIQKMTKTFVAVSFFLSVCSMYIGRTKYSEDDKIFVAVLYFLCHLLPEIILPKMPKNIRCSVIFLYYLLPEIILQKMTKTFVAVIYFLCHLLP